MSTYDVASITLPSSLAIGDIITCSYTGSYKTITLPKGTYKLECWGAQGGSYNTTYAGGKGGYSCGTLSLTENTNLYLYTGGAGTTIASSGSVDGGFNGGGLACTSNSTYTLGAGGGASDIRIGSTSLYSRVIVAGGGGGCVYSSDYKGSGGAGGGSSGVNGTKSSTGSYNAGTGGTQTGGGLTYYKTTAIDTAGVFGAGGYGDAYTNGGGGGWYGGGGSRRSGAGGGSGYIYTSSTASSYPSGCTLNSSYYLTDASTKAGNTSFTDYSGSTVTGHGGNGAIKITILQLGAQITDIYLKIGENNWKKLFDLTSKKPPVIPVTINLTLTSSTVTVNGTTYTASTSIETVNPVSVIFTLQGSSYMGQGTVTLNGTNIYTTNIADFTGSETFTWNPSESYNTITINCQTTNTWASMTQVTITTA